DTIAAIIDPALLNYSDLSSASTWLCVLGYTFQLYFDFSGYSDMAVGLGHLFGLRLPQNFRSPYKATDIADFWRRWHISLSSCLRDYLYIPLGGGRGPTYLVYRNLLVTMLLGGLWHGANWTFVAWGAYHGLLLIGYRVFDGPTVGTAIDKAMKKRWFVAFSVDAIVAACVLGAALFRPDVLQTSACG